MLAYSSIAHTGYMLVGLRWPAAREPRDGLEALLFYGVRLHVHESLAHSR